MKTKTKEIKVYLHKHIDLYNFELLSEYEEPSDDYITIGKGVAVIDLAEQDETELVVDALGKQKTKAIAEHEQKIMLIDDKIQQLLAISHDGAGK